MEPIETSPQTDEIAALRSALSEMTAGPDPDGYLALSALSDLEAVAPPYPPLRPWPDDKPAPTIAEAQALTTRAVHTSTNVQELARLGDVAATLSGDFGEDSA